MDKIPVRKYECGSCGYSDYRMSSRDIGELLPGECPKCRSGMVVRDSDNPLWLLSVLDHVSREFELVDFVALENGLEAEVRSKNPKKSFRNLMKRVRTAGYLPVMRGKDGSLRLFVMKYPKQKRANPVVNIALLAATCASTFLAGYYFIFGEIPDAALFSVSIMLMLGVHELGHKIAARRSGVESTLPYFIPAPNLLGTMGAVINVKSPIPTKESLIEMGVAGPLAGFAVAVPIILVGLFMSSPDPSGVSFGFVPAVFALMQIATFGYVPPAIRLNPLIFSGWVMLLLTMLNMMPAGQLDGGHVARGLMRKETHYILTRSVGFGLFITGILFPGMPFWFWGFLILLFFRTYHPGALDDVSDLSRSHRVLGAIAFAVFALCLPVPLV
ncbi:MAG: site-2 protease family protein [Candidatus Hadarchaeales archaeon]